MLKIAVLGAGRIGKIHAANIATHPQATLVAVADPFINSANALADLYGAKAVSDPLELINDADIDAVIIATPTDTHVDLMLAAARQGKKVLCEKPVDLDLNRAAEACRQLEELNAPVMVAFNRRFDPSASELQQAIASGDIGDLHQVVITSRDPDFAPMDYLRHSGGIFSDMVIHDFDMARWLLGEEPVEVYASASRLLKPELAEFNDYDTVMVQMTTASGRQCHINCSRRAVYGYDQRLEAFGSAGMLLNNNQRANSVRRYTAAATEVQAPLEAFFLERYEQAYRLEMDAFIQAALGKRAIPVTPFDGLMALKLAECAARSAASGRPVSVD